MMLHRLHQLYKTTTTLAMGLWLCACSSLPPDIVSTGKTTHFWLSGRMSIQHEQPNQATQTASGQIEWWHDSTKQRDRIDIRSPFGQVIAQLKGEAGDVRLHLNNGRQFQAASLTELARQGLGQNIPFEHIPDWLEGISSASAQVTRDANHRPISLNDGVWSLRYSYPDNPLQKVPETLFAQSTEGISLRLRVDRWRTGDAVPNWPEP